jgi:hypothetical protein
MAVKCQEQANRPTISQVAYKSSSSVWGDSQDSRYNGFVFRMTTYVALNYMLGRHCNSQVIDAIAVSHLSQQALAYTRAQGPVSVDRQGLLNYEVRILLVPSESPARFKARPMLYNLVM